MQSAHQRLSFFPFPSNYPISSLFVREVEYISPPISSTVITEHNSGFQHLLSLLLQTGLVSEE